MGDVVGRNREGEHPPLGIPGLHHFDVGAVDQLHFRLQVAIGKWHFLTTDHRHLLAQVFRADPIEGQVGEWRLGAPARRHVEVVDELLHRLTHLGVAQLIFAHIRRKIGVERAERLGAGPFVLQGAEEVDHLPQGTAQMLGRPRFDATRHAIEAFVQQRTQRPTGAVAGEHVEVVDMQIRLTVCAADLLAVDLVQPVIGSDLARHVQHQPAEGIPLVGIGLHAPVFTVEVFVHRGGDFHQGLAVAAQATVLFAVDDIRAHRQEVTGVHQHPLDAVLDLLHIQPFDAAQPRQYRTEQQVDLGLPILAGGIAGGDQRLTDFFGVEGNEATVAFVQAVTDQRAEHALHWKAPDTTYRFNKSLKHNMQ